MCLVVMTKRDMMDHPLYNLTLLEVWQWGSGRPPISGDGGGGGGHHDEIVKGKCALGSFLSILVIKCPTQMVMC
jgi:hypothetical protein